MEHSTTCKTILKEDNERKEINVKWKNKFKVTSTLSNDGM